MENVNVKETIETTQTTDNQVIATPQQPEQKSTVAKVAKIGLVLGAIGAVAYGFKKYVWDAGLLDDLLGNDATTETTETAVDIVSSLFK